MVPMGQIICVVGTRPEVIKMAPVVLALKEAGHDARILATAQHRHLLDQMLRVFDLAPDWDLDAMRPNQGLPDLTGTLVPALDRVFRAAGPDLVLAQGDTATVLCAALAAFYARIPFGHVEAGLRSGDLAAPFPEEGNRRLVSQVADLHFAPTERARQALLREGIDPAGVHQVGNTVIDALLQTAGRADLAWPAEVPTPAPGSRLVLVTLHRRENFGAPLERILATLRNLAVAHPELQLVYPVHPNPNVLEPARRVLGRTPGVTLCEPLDYPALVALLKASWAVFTDSGGLQEEAPALGKPVLVFREVTERPEAVEAGSVRLVGSDPLAIHHEVERLRTDPAHHAAMSVPRFPYGDGRSGRRIARIIGAFLESRRGRTTVPTHSI